MALINVSDLSFGHGGPLLLDGVELQIADGERICLVGRNGEGKSTFLKLLSGETPGYGGAIARRQGLRVARLGQEVPRRLEGSTYQLVAAGLGSRGELLHRHHELAERVADSPTVAALAELERVQRELDSGGAWEIQREIDRVLSRLSLDPDAAVAELSAGTKRRALLARALVSEPDLLLLDEPTNHLDLDVIAWLEEFLLRHEATLLFVSHDRVFLQRLATRILELDRGRLTSWRCDYATFLKRRAEALENEAKEWRRQDKKLASEEIWVRKGVRERRTRNEGRVRALKELREQRRARREQAGPMRAEVHEGRRSGQLVIEAKDLSFGFGERPIVSNFATKIMRGDKIGLIGPNGIGKSTLLRLLLGELEPDTGGVRHGTQLNVAWFDQLLEQLDEDKSLFDNVSDGQESVVVGGRKRHIVAYLEDFLFTPDRIHSRVSSLSGGERNRLLLARLFTRSANLLVLDEPTNDLDIESLEMLEMVLIDYPGTILIVSHDRAFLNNVVTSSFVFEGDGRVREVVGGYDAWQRLREQRRQQDGTKARKPVAKTRGAVQEDGRKRLTYMEQRELEGLPGKIEELEASIAEWYRRMAEAEFYEQEAALIEAATTELDGLKGELAEAYERWLELDSRA